MGANWLLPGVFAMTDLLWSRFDRGTLRLRCDGDLCGRKIALLLNGFVQTGTVLLFSVVAQRFNWNRNRLFMAASHSLYSLYVNTQGAPGG
jgi:hypothetical protein